MCIPLDIAFWLAKLCIQRLPLAKYSNALLEIASVASKLSNLSKCIFRLGYFCLWNLWEKAIFE